MKCIVFSLTLCFIVISCSSTPSGEVQAGVEPTASMAGDVIQPEENAVLEDQSTAQEIVSQEIVSQEIVSQEIVSQETLPSENFFPVDDFLPPLVRSVEMDYIQEHELLGIDELPPSDTMEIVPGSEALIVESLPADVLPELDGLQPNEEDDKAIVIEEVAEDGADGVIDDVEELVQVIAPEAATALLASEEEGEVEIEVAVPAEESSEAVVVSRSVAMNKNQYLDIRYPGAGWVFLGEVTEFGNMMDSSRLTYFGRRRTDSDTTFTLRSVDSGETILHFFKQDVLTATFIDDYLFVTISDEPAKGDERVLAPSYGELVPMYQDERPLPEDFSPVAMMLIDSELTDDSAAVAPDTTLPDSDVVVAAEELVVGESVTGTDGGLDGTGAVMVERPSIVSQGAADSQEIAAVVAPEETEIIGSLDQENDDAGEDASNGNIVYSENSSNVEETPDVLNVPLDTGETEGAAVIGGGEAPETRDESQFQQENQRLDSSADELLAQAQEFFRSEEYQLALDSLDRFFAAARNNFDAGYYLKGQILEAKSPLQDIRAALKSYRYVVETYPKSPFWNRAKDRHTYLSRFYFDIR